MGRSEPSTREFISISKKDALKRFNCTEVLLNDVVNVFERDNTSRPNRIVEDISIESAKMVQDVLTLLRRLEVHRAGSRCRRFVY